MIKYDITMEHTEESLTALSHMQYDLFCTRNFIVRNLLSLVVIVVGSINFLQFFKPHSQEADRSDQGLRKRISILQISIYRERD